MNSRASEAMCVLWGKKLTKQTNKNNNNSTKMLNATSSLWLNK